MGAGSQTETVDLDAVRSDGDSVRVWVLWVLCSGCCDVGVLGALMWVLWVL